MRWFRWAAIGIFVLGFALLGAAVVRGEAIVYLFLVFPVIQATGPLAFGAIAAVFAGILLFFAAFAIAPPEFAIPPEEPPASPPRTQDGSPTPRRRGRAGGVIFLGPFPIVFGSDSQVARWMIIVAFLLFVLLLAFWIAVAIF